MPWFWQMPCASMGLSTPSAIYQARFAKYLEHRGLKKDNGGKIWAFIGDGESDEPEVLGTIAIAAREQLDNIVLAVNCNLQRLDGPVRGNGKIIQELERAFRGADWHVIKVIWGGGWDILFERDADGVLQDRMEQAVDGDYQMYSISPGDVQREHLGGEQPRASRPHERAHRRGSAGDQARRPRPQEDLRRLQGGRGGRRQALRAALEDRQRRRFGTWRRGQQHRASEEVL